MCFRFVSVLAFCAFVSGAACAETPAASTTTSQPAAATAMKPCQVERQAVTDHCKKGDPCGEACKQARKDMRACRKANNLQTPIPKGPRKPDPCKSNGKLKPAPAATTETPAKEPVVPKAHD